MRYIKVDGKKYPVLKSERDDKKFKVIINGTEIFFGDSYDCIKAFGIKGKGKFKFVNIFHRNKWKHKKNKSKGKCKE